MTDLTLRDLERSEAIIKSGLRMFFEVGAELLKIKNDELYRFRGYDTWKDYCKGQWGWTTQHAGRLVRAAEVVSELQSEPMGSVPSTERVARELARIPTPSDRPLIWQLAIDAYGARPTAAQVRKVVDELYPQNPESPPSVDGASKPSSEPPSLANEGGGSSALPPMSAATEAEQAILDRLLKPNEMADFETGLDLPHEYQCYLCNNWFFADQMKRLHGNRYCYSCRQTIDEPNDDDGAAAETPVYETTLFDEVPPEPAFLPDANGTLPGSDGQATAEPPTMTEQDPYDEMLLLAGEIFPLLSSMGDVRTYGIYGPLRRFIELFKEIHQVKT